MNTKYTAEIGMVDAALALPDRGTPIHPSVQHRVLRHSLIPPFPGSYESILLGMGCFWGAERKLWVLSGVYTTAVGYAGGYTVNPSYEDVCSGKTGHTEVVLIVYDPKSISLMSILKNFWEFHDPTQGFRQGNDLGTQYRSAIYYYSLEQAEAIERSKSDFQSALLSSGFGEITTEIKQAERFFYAENYHQQYLDKNPNGYCGLKGTGVSAKSKK